MEKRIIQEQIEENLFKGKIIILYGARQVGKTTIIRMIQEKHPDSLYLNCDEPDVREALTNKTSTEMKAIFSAHKLIFIDEAQRVENIGLALKLVHDNFPEIQLVATGSSSFELSNRIAEPLTGRKIEFLLAPLSIRELLNTYDKLELERLLPQRLIFGMYPAIVYNPEKVERDLKNLASSYSYQDVLAYQNLKHSEMLERLLKALALQIGNEVSYNELANTVGIDKVTVASYISILEKAFIIFRVGPYSRNVRTELKKLRKIYFFDNGMRNALINNLNPLDLRSDVGALWENFVMSERWKFNHNASRGVNMYFWRTRQKQELDLIEEKGGAIEAFEIKYNKDKFLSPKIFVENYPGASIRLINRNNFFDFV